MASGRRRRPVAEGVREGPAAPDPPSVGTEGSLLPVELMVHVARGILMTSGSVGLGA